MKKVIIVALAVVGLTALTLGLGVASNSVIEKANACGTPRCE